MTKYDDYSLDDWYKMLNILKDRELKVSKNVEFYISRGLANVYTVIMPKEWFAIQSFRLPLNAGEHDIVITLILYTPKYDGSVKEELFHTELKNIIPLLAEATVR